jgi:hypothetical protein
MPYSPGSSWIEPEFCISTIGSLKRLRSDNCTNSDTSDDHPWKVPTSETSVHYDYGDSFGYEVYMLKIAADELDEPGSPSSEDEPLSVDELQIEKDEVRLSELDGIETISCGDDDNLISMIIHSPPSRLEIDVNREELKSDAIRRHIEALKVDEEDTHSDSDSDSDGYESDFSYFTVSPVSVAPVVGRTVQVLVVDDSALQRKISRCLLSGKVLLTTSYPISSFLFQHSYFIIPISLFLILILSFQSQKFLSHNSLILFYPTLYHDTPLYSGSYSSSLSPNFNQSLVLHYLLPHIIICYA